MKTRSGFSLFEMLIVLFIFAIGLLLLMFDFRQARAMEDLKATAQEIVDLAHRAQAWSIGGRPHGASPPLYGYGLRVTCSFGAQGASLVAVNDDNDPPGVDDLGMSVSIRSRVDVKELRIGGDDPGKDVCPADQTMFIAYEPPGRRPFVKSHSDFPVFVSGKDTFIYLQNATFNLCRRVTVSQGGTASHARVSCP